MAAGLSAAAQERAAPDPLPSERYSREDMARFRDCRVAAYYHLDGAEDPAATVPRSLAAALLAQINFVMSEALERTPPPRSPMRRAAWPSPSAS
jgi:hypothetical protein